MPRRSIRLLQRFSARPILTAFAVFAAAASTGCSPIISVHHAEVPINFQIALAKELSFEMSLAYPDEFPAVIAALCDTSVDISALVSHHYGFGDFLEAFEVSQDKQNSAKVLVHCDG